MSSGLRPVARYVLPVFLGAFLLFQVQPIVARRILPWYGGTPAVWTTCMLFFQVLLLVGYAYAHLLVARLTSRRQAVVHGCLLVLAVAMLAVAALTAGVPLLPPDRWRPAGGEWPVTRILLTLVAAVGLPYAILAGTSPLLQAWFHRTHPSASPYRLYALSNAGSLLGLVTYPFLIEPALTMRGQALAWSAGFGVFALGLGYCAARLFGVGDPGNRAQPETQADGASPAGPPGLWHWLRWLALAALASLMLLALTNHMCQEIAVVPFLWVLPLSLYLLSFIICFDHPRWYQRDIYVPVLIGACVVALVALEGGQELDIRTQIAGGCVLLFACCMVCHGELALSKPPPRHLTSFYMAVATGGALGGVLVGLVAPLVFDSFAEVYVGIGACLLVGAVALCELAPLWLQLVRGGFAVAFGAALLWVFLGMPGAATGVSAWPTVARSRSFYGVFRVEDWWPGDPEEERYALIHGSTIHGYQFLAPEKRRIPTSYYTAGSGVARAFAHHPRRQRGSIRTGVTGLGAGSVAVYARKGDTIRFYDIDPQVVELSTRSGLFTYISDCPAQVDVVLGDARISMERELAEEGSQQFDLLLLDAFSSDAVPAHLLTREAFATYLAHLRAPDGFLLVHISNKHLDLRPVVRALAEHYGLASAQINHRVENSTLAYPSDWVLLCRDPEPLQTPGIAEAAVTLDDARRLRLWTDDYYSLFSILY